MQQAQRNEIKQREPGGRGGARKATLELRPKKSALFHKSAGTDDLKSSWESQPFLSGGTCLTLRNLSPKARVERALAAKE